ncbi:hypothetical protein Baya_1829 [Bagarius yarrelli]|uniref:Ig-like domain-containing protein n=1 Tax=Bagarius yarrelli TaxID=175774 RepID=A0A556TM82_BAGYA|nr:hypothetical protein Baya_1829 [Bagarius yarrelli]
MLHFLSSTLKPQSQTGGFHLSFYRNSRRNVGSRFNRCPALGSPSHGSQCASEGNNTFLFCLNDGKVTWEKGVDGGRLALLTAGNGAGVIEHKHDRRYGVLSDLSLLIKNLSLSDSGLYYCNSTPVVYLNVTPSHTLKRRNTDHQYETIDDIQTAGPEAVVCEGGTVYLRCGLPKQRWAFKHDSESRREFISTRYKNGTVLKERPDPHSRFTHTSDHLQIQNLQQLDSGTYYCSGKDIAVLSVTSVVLVVVVALCVLAVVTVVLLSVIVCLRFSGRKKLTASKPEESVLSLQTTHSHDADVVTLQSAGQLL